MSETKLNVRVTPEYLQRLKLRALLEQTTVTELVLRVLGKYLDAHPDTVTTKQS